MNNIRSYLLLISIAIFLSFCNAPVKENVVLNLDESLKKLSLLDFEGKEVMIEDYLQKPLLINYWATWCGPCKKEFPFFDSFIKRNHKDINVIMISDESLEKINTFKNSNNYNFTYLKSTKKLRSYFINIIPTTAYYNAKGEHLEGVQGSVYLELLEDMVKYHKGR